MKCPRCKMVEMRRLDAETLQCPVCRAEMTQKAGEPAVRKPAARKPAAKKAAAKKA